MGAHFVPESLRRSPGPHHTVLLGATAVLPEPQGAGAPLPPVRVRIVPASACVPGTIEPFTIYECADKVFTVALPHRHHTVFLADADVVQCYRSTFRALAREATDSVRTF